jgi:hypothetical protein
MKNILAIMLCLVAFTAFASDRDKPAASTSESTSSASANNEGVRQDVTLGGQRIVNGFQWKTRFCKDQDMIAFFLSIGDYQTACDIVRTGEWGKQAAKRGIPLPQVCKAPAQVDLSGYVKREELAPYPTREELAERWKKINE